jgi:RimJ/RimL family protein N-acetyltransferase
MRGREGLLPAVPDDCDPDEIITARLRLRRARAEDVGAIHAILSDPRAVRYWSSLPFTDIEQSRAWLAGMIEAPADEADDYVVERAGRVIGKAGCWRLPEIGYILHPDHWGQGRAREALSALIPALFARHELDALTADVDPRNAASLRLLARLGFQETGRAARTIQVGEAWQHSVYLALRRPGADVTA